jgi:hypothetical protein
MIPLAFVFGLAAGVLATLTVQRERARRARRGILLTRRVP